MTFETKYRNFVGRMKELSREEMIVIARELLDDLNNDRSITINGWKGKSSFNFHEVGDKIIVTKFQKPEKDAEPKEVNYEIEAKELREIEMKIKYFFKFLNLPERNDEKYLTSRELGEDYYKAPWSEIFNNRKTHNRFTIILNVLEQKGIIDYRGGNIYLK